MRRWLIVLCLTAACGDDPAAPDAGARDAARDSGPADSGVLDSGRADSGPSDSGPFDAGPLCLGGTFECLPGEGCAGGLCGACSENAHCLAREVCTSEARCGACSDQAPCDEDEICRFGVCLPGELPRWNLIITPENFAALIEDPWADLEVPCTLESGGVSYAEGCTVRLRGGSSREWPKRSFRIEFPEDLPHPGLSRHINLRAEYNDFSYLRNALALATFEQVSRIPSPKQRFVRLELNGEPYGLMSEVERIGGKFLEDNGRDRDRSLYEADPGRELFLRGAGSLVPLPDEATYRAAFDKKTGDDTYTDLIEFVDAIWADHEALSTQRIRSRLDVDAYLRYLALLGVLQNHDHVRKNYYLSFQNLSGRDRVEFYPWDLDLSLGCLYDDLEDNTLCDTLISDARPDRGRLGDVPAGYPVEAFYNLLIHRVLADSDLESRFEARLCALVGGPYWNETLPRMIDAYEAHVREAAVQDLMDRVEGGADFASRVEELRIFLGARRTHLESTLACP